MTRRSLFLLLVSMLGTARTAGAQSRWKEIRKTSTGNAVFVDTKTVKKHGAIVDATIRIEYAKPVDTPQGKITSSRTIGMFDCEKRQSASKESIQYIDEAAGRIARRDVMKIPGYGVAFKGTASDVALDY